MSEEKIQVSQQFADKMASVGAALGGLGQDNTFSPNQAPSIIESLEVIQPTNQGKTEVSSQGLTPTEGNPPAAENQTQGVAKTGDEAQQKATSAEEGGAFEIDSPITGKIKIGEKNEAEEVIQSFDKIEDFEKLAKDNGFEDTKKFVAELPKLIEAQKKYDEVSATNKSYSDFLETLPPDLFDAMRKFGKGEDWRAGILAKDPIAYNVEFEKHDTKNLVENYYPGKISQEEWEEFNDKDGDASIKEKVENYVSLTKDKFGIDQEKFKAQTEAYERNATQAVQARRESLDKSRTSVFEAFKSSGLTIDENYVGTLDKTLSSDQAILSLFKNEDGTLRADAHQRAAMANDGFGLVTQYQKAIERRIVTKAREEILDRNGSGPQAIKKTGDSISAGVDEAQQKVTAFLDKALPKENSKTF